MYSPGTLDRVRQTLESFQTVSSLAEDTLNDKYSETRKPALFSRALVWKLTILKINKVNAQRGHDGVELSLNGLNKLRRDYGTLKTQYIVPWHELSQQSEYYTPLNIADDGFDLADDLNKRQEVSRMRVIRDPLSEAADEDNSIGTPNKVRNQETDAQLLEAISTDVDRLFPECPEYFIKSPANRRKIIEILYRWCKLNDVTYFQGLHELCGLIYLVFLSESIDPRRFKHPDRLDTQILSLMDPEMVAEDTFNVFNTLMKPIMANYYSESALLQQSIMFDLKLHQTDRFLYHLFKNKFRLDSRIWLMRYFRLVMIREVGLAQSLKLWDKLITFSFLRDPFKGDIDLTLLVPYIVIVMLAAIKPRLIVSDYGEALYLLLHYPTKTNDQAKLAQLKDSIIFIQDDEQDTSANDINFQYIEENHHRQSGASPVRGSGEVSEEECYDSDDDPELVRLNMNKVVQDAIRLYNMSDKELEKNGAKLLEHWSGMHNAEDKRGRLSTSPSSSSKWQHSSKLVLEPATLQPARSPELKVSRSPEPKDFDRSRLEMRLQKKVGEVLKKS